METCGMILHISTHYDHSKYLYTTDEVNLIDSGYTWDTPAWEPELYDFYVYIDARGHVSNSTWYNNERDNYRRDFLGIYQSKELCEAALLEIRRKLGK